MGPKVASHIGIALLVLSAGAISAQAPPQSPPQKVVRDSGAVTAASAALAALGGTPGAICAVGTDSRIRPDGATSVYPIRVCASGASSRVELSLPAGTLVRIVSGGAGAIISPGGKVRTLDPQNTAYEVPIYFPGLALADLLANPERSVLDSGTKSVGGAEYHEIELPFEAEAGGPLELNKHDTRNFRALLDRQTGAIAGVVFKQTGEQANSPDFAGLVSYSDFESVSGYRFPTLIVERDFDSAEPTGSSRIAFTLHFTSFEINPPLPANAFSVPPGGAR
ncbi:MAG: hypothetical protein ACRD2H_03235 [Terriglobales bacterium]